MKKLLKGHFYYDPILGLRYVSFKAYDIANNATPNRSERRKIKFQSRTYKNKFGLTKSLF